MAGPAGPIGPGGGIPFSTEWLNAQKKALKEGGIKDDSEQVADRARLSEDAKKQAFKSTKSGKMLKSMQAKLGELDTDSEDFLEEATEQVIDSVLDEEFGENLKKKPGYSSMQEKIAQTILENDDSRQAIEEFIELLLAVEEEEEHEDSQEPHDQDFEDDEEESFEEDPEDE